MYLSIYYAMYLLYITFNIKVKSYITEPYPPANGAYSM
jgi:hypothetical protein